MCFKKKEKEKSWYSGSYGKKIKTPKKRKLRKRIIALVAVLLVVGLAGLYFYNRYIDISPWEPYETDEETLLSLAPKNEEQSKAIEAMPGYSENDSWAFYVYMVGSDLESRGLDELSSLTKYLVNQEVKAYTEKETKETVKAITNFVKEVNAQGMDLPQILYNPTINSGSSSESSSAEYDPDIKGFASSDINEISSSEIPENLQIVIQPGGSKRWQNSQINPNRCQRFLVNSEELLERVYDAPLVNMSKPDSLSDFINYCTENYPADHCALILWNHGGATSGYGQDEIYGFNILTLKDIHKALEDSVGSEGDEPYFELIGFDACLMSCLEAAHELYPYAKYMSASEEVEPGDGWPYSDIIEYLAENPACNGAQLGKEVADAFVECCIESLAEYGYVEPSTFSLIDLSKVEQVYEAYCEFCAEALKKAAEKPSVLADISRSAQRSVAYGSSAYRVCNMIDLGVFMQEAKADFPESAQKVLDAVDDCVMYVRSCSYLSESTGLSVYFPARIEGTGGLRSFLEYINDVSDNKDVNALYYYKLTGCLNDKLRDYTESEGYDEIKNIDYSIMNAIPGHELTCLGDGNMAMSLSDEEMNLTQAVRFGLAWYDPETYDIIYYGEDGYAFYDPDGKINTNFNGRWVYFDGHPLPLEVVSETGDNITFRTPVEYNGLDAWLMIGYDAESDEYSVLGVREELNEAGTLDRSLLTLKDGAYITIKYEAGNLLSNASETVTEDIKFNSNTSFEDRELDNGSYLEYIIVEDIRADTYYSPIVSFEIKNGEISNQLVDEELYSYEKG